MSYILVSSYFMRAIDFFGSCSGFEMSIPFANNLRTCCIAFFLIAEMDRIRSDEIAKEGQQLRKHYEGTIRALANQTPTTVSIFWGTFPTRVSSCFVPTRYGWLLTTVRYAQYLGGLLEGVLQQRFLCKDLRSVCAMSITIVLYIYI